MKFTRLTTTLLISLVLSGCAHTSSGNISQSPATPIEELIAATNEAAGIGIPGNGIANSAGNVSQFTGKPAGAGPGALNTSIATGGPGAQKQAYEAAKTINKQTNNPNRTIGILVMKGVKPGIAISATNKITPLPPIPAHTGSAGWQTNKGFLSEYSALMTGDNKNRDEIIGILVRQQVSQYLAIRASDL